MFNIYEALKSGQTTDEIAQKFVEELNAANAKIEADKAAAEAEAAKNAQKEKDTQAVVDCINAYLAIYYPTIQPIDAAFINETIRINESANKVVEDLQKDDIDIENIFKNFFESIGL